MSRVLTSTQLPKSLHLDHLFALCAVLLSLSAGCSQAHEALATSPLIGATRVDQRGEALVLEKLPAGGGYTYLRLSSAKSGVWHVVNSAPQSANRRDSDLVSRVRHARPILLPTFETDVS